MHNEMWRDVVSESVRRLRLSQLSGCIFYLSEECFQEVFKNRKTLFNCLKKRYNHSIKTGRCSMEQKEQTKCMGSDGMQKMNGVHDCGRDSSEAGRRIQGYGKRKSTGGIGSLCRISIAA